MTVDTEVIYHAPTATIVTVTELPTATVTVVETELVTVQEVGTAGRNGAPGSTGTQGPQGLSAYELAVQEGFSGTEMQWIASLIGAMGQQGAQGPAGPQGVAGTPGSSGSTYVHNQGGAATTWMVVHNLGFYPNVTTVDSSNVRMEGEVDYIDSNSLTLTFSASVGGRAYLS